MKVRISDAYTNQEIFTYSINLGSTNHLLDQDYFEEAWAAAIEDKLVNPDRREQYKFESIIE